MNHHQYHQITKTPVSFESSNLGTVENTATNCLKVSLGFQTPCEDVFGPQKQSKNISKTKTHSKEVFGRLGYIASTSFGPQNHEKWRLWALKIWVISVISSRFWIILANLHIMTILKATNHRFKIIPSMNCSTPAWVLYRSIFFFVTSLPLARFTNNLNTPLKTNMSPENQWLEDVFPIQIQGGPLVVIDKVITPINGLING